MTSPGTVQGIVIEVMASSGKKVRRRLVEIAAVPVIDGDMRDDCSFVTTCAPDDVSHAVAAGLSLDEAKKAPASSEVLQALKKYLARHPLWSWESELVGQVLKSESQIAIMGLEVQVQDLRGVVVAKLGLDKSSLPDAALKIGIATDASLFRALPRAVLGARLLAASCRLQEEF